MDSVRFQKISDVPVASDGYSLATKSVANDGSLLFLFVEPEGAAAVTENYAQGIGIFPRAKMKESKRFRLYVVPAAGSSRTFELPELDVTFPLVDVFPDGKILVVASRCQWRGEQDYDLNAIIFDPATAQSSRILLGDGINRAYVDGLGRIWVAYFDEGIFGNFGWGTPPGPAPIGSAGLVCFSELGEKVWEYPADTHAPIADCYVLNVSGSEVAVHFDALRFDSVFHACKVSSEFELTFWKTRLRGCHEFAISETSALFTGQYNDPPDRGYLGTLGAGGIVDASPVRLLLPDGSGLPKGQLLGRGRHLYYFDAASVYRASLD